MKYARQNIDILNAQGRRKADFITNAILQYIGAGTTAPEEGIRAYDPYEIEQIVKRVLEKQKELEKAESVKPAIAAPRRKKPPKSEEIAVTKEDLDADIPDDMLASISQFVSDLRK